MTGTTLRMAVLVAVALACTGCQYVSRIDKPPRNCIVLTTLAGCNAPDIRYTANSLLKGSYEKTLVDKFLAQTGADREAFDRTVAKPDQELDGKVLKHILDITYQMWWRDEWDGWSKTAYRH